MPTVGKASSSPKANPSHPGPGGPRVRVSQQWKPIPAPTLTSTKRSGQPARSQWPNRSNETTASEPAGSRPACRLIPRDTPQIGRRLDVHLDQVPTNVGVLAMGWARVQPGASLGALGMPGCARHVTLDGLQVLAGSAGTALWSLTIPDQPALLGVRFYNQALLLDPAAGNGFGAVVSDAAEAVVGG